MLSRQIRPSRARVLTAQVAQGSILSMAISLLVTRLAPLALCILTLVVVVPRIHPFLAITKPVHGDVLVVEGWVHEYMIPQAVRVFETGDYRAVVTTGIRAASSAGGQADDATGTAAQAAARLVRYGLPADTVTQVPAAAVRTHKTAASAKALRLWLAAYPQYRSVDVFTGGPHARKTLVIFRRVLGTDIKVGVIAGRIEHYSPERWWLSWRSIEVVTRYFFGYFYALAWPWW